MRTKLILFTCLGFFSQFMYSQTYIEVRNYLGHDISAFLGGLNEAAEIVADSLPEELHDSFKVYSSSYYLHSNSFNDFESAFIQNEIDSILMINSCFLYIGKIFYPGESKMQFKIHISLPNNWLENCFDDSYIQNLRNNIELIFARYKTENTNLEYLINFESKSIKEVGMILGKVNCCLPGVRSGGSCDNCITAYELLSNLEFYKSVPFANCKVINPDTAINPNCVCESIVSINSSSYSSRSNANVSILTDYQIEIAGQSFSLEDQLLFLGTRIDSFYGLITNNTFFCDIDTQTFYLNKYNVFPNSVWLHIWEDPVVDSNSILFIRMKFKESDLPQSRSPQNCDEAFKKSSWSKNNSDYKYTISHRCFAPWDWFGSIPIFPDYHVLKNKFHGDNRGFSLLNSDVQKSINTTTGRLNQSIRFSLNGSRFEDGTERFASLTTGYRNFISTLPKTYWEPARELSVDYGFSNTKGHEKVTKLFNGVNIDLLVYGKNPLVSIISKGNTWFTPNLKNSLKVNLYIDDETNSLHIHGTACTKNFPSYEAFIQDECGTKIFLLTAPCACESDIGHELLSAILDYQEYFDYRVPIDDNGCFLNSIIISQVNWLIHQEQDIQVYSIEDWNTVNLGKNPADDCTGIPCEGAYTNNGQDLRSYFNCDH